MPLQVFFWGGGGERDMYQKKNSDTSAVKVFCWYLDALQHALLLWKHLFFLQAFFLSTTTTTSFICTLFILALVHFFMMGPPKIFIVRNIHAPTHEESFETDPYNLIHCGRYNTNSQNRTVAIIGVTQEGRAENYSSHGINDIVRLPLKEEAVHQLFLKWAGHTSCEG